MFIWVNSWMITFSGIPSAFISQSRATSWFLLFFSTGSGWLKTQIKKAQFPGNTFLMRSWHGFQRNSTKRWSESGEKIAKRPISESEVNKQWLTKRSIQRFLSFISLDRSKLVRSEKLIDHDYCLVLYVLRNQNLLSAVTSHCRDERYFDCNWSIDPLFIRPLQIGG